MASDSTQAPWRKSTFDPQVPLRGGASYTGGGHRNTGGRGATSGIGQSPSWGRGAPRGRWLSPSSGFNNRGGHFASPSYPAESLPPARDIMEGLQSVPLKRLEGPRAAKGDEDVRIQGCEYIGSYSWTNCENPTVIVPGGFQLSNLHQETTLISLLTLCRTMQALLDTGSTAVLLIMSSQMLGPCLLTRTDIGCQRRPSYP